MKTITTLFIFLFISQTLAAENSYFKGDTIRYRFDKMLVEVSSTNALSKSPEKIQMQERIKQVQKVLGEMTISSPADDERVTISFRETGDGMTTWNFKEISLSREKKSTKNLAVFDDGTIFEKEYGRYCLLFFYREAEVKIFVDNLAGLEFFLSETFNKKAQQAAEFLAKETIRINNKNYVRACLDLRGDDVKGYIQNNSNKTSDMLIISGGVGSGWVKNTFVSDFNLKFGIGFGKKGMFKNLYSVEWSLMYDFSESNENDFFKVNHFLSLYWDHNFSNTPQQDKWYGFSFGCLKKRNNDFFKNNTFRFTINKKINDTFSVSPEIYFNDFFKNVYPGIRLQVAF